MIKTVIRAAAVVAATALASTATLAQDTSGETPAATPATPPPPCQDEAFRAFDFWIGEWDVHLPDGQMAGVNSIQPINGGCGLLERYSVGGQLYGQSYNFFDPVLNIWTQIWLSPGVIIRMEGPVTDSGLLVLTGTITNTSQAASQPFFGRWTLQEDGTVLQEFWNLSGETGEWVNGFTGIYTRTD